MRISPLLKLVVVLLLTLLVVPFGAAASDDVAADSLQEKDAIDDSDRAWGLNVTAGVYTEYMFRGKTVYEGTSAQPSVTGYYDFGEWGAVVANIWAQIPTETNEPPEKFTEVDYTLSYDLTLDFVTLTVGHIFYSFPGDDESRIKDTVEYFMGASLDVIGNPTFTFYNDYDEGEYQYYTLGFNHTFHTKFLGEQNGIVPHVRFGFASNATDGPVLYEDNGLVHIDTGVAFEIPLGEVLLIPHFNFNFETDDAANNEFWFGIDVSYDI